MEVANELKRLTNDAYTIGLYDEEEERRRIENSIKITAKKQGVNNEKNSIAKNLLNIGIPKESIMQATGLSETQIARLM